MVPKLQIFNGSKLQIFNGSKIGKYLRDIKIISLVMMQSLSFNRRLSKFYFLMLNYMLLK